jgi:hypothetical protein
MSFLLLPIYTLNRTGEKQRTVSAWKRVRREEEGGCRGWVEK